MNLSNRITHREDLLVERALHGLAARDDRELRGLLPRTFEAETSSYERAAAALHLALLARSLEPLPSTLRDRIASTAHTHQGRDPDPEQGDN